MFFVAYFLFSCSLLLKGGAMVKKVLIMLLCVCLLIVLIIGAYYFKNPKVMEPTSVLDYNYLSFDLMVYEADVIAIIETKERYRERKKMDGYMQTDIKIQKIIKSNVSSVKEGSVVSVNEAFYLDWFRLFLTQNYNPLTRNESYLLFLKKHPINGNYTILNLNSGRYQITGEETVNRFEDFEEEVWDSYKDEIEDMLKNEATH